jgi:WD40 repeat protein
MPYKAFISYSHAADGKLAPALQSGLHRFARPWYRTRTMRVFRDQTNLSVSPDLWDEIENGLSNAEFFILLASPEASASKWVRQEVDFWLKHRGPETLLLAVTDGEIKWDDQRGDFDWHRTTALPPNLAGVFERTPHYLEFQWARTSEDLSLHNPLFADKVADLATKLLGVSKDEIIGEDVRQHRRIKQVVAAVIAVLSVVTAAALYQWRQAVEQRNIAVARQLAAQSELVRTQQGRLIQQSVLLALESLHRFPSLEADQALRASLSLLPTSVVTLSHGAGVLGTALGSDGRSVITAGTDGSVRVWNVPERRETVNFVAFGEILAFAMSPDGRYVATGNLDNAARIFETASGRLVTRLPHAGQVNLVSFSSDGRYLATGSNDSTVALWTVPDGQQVAQLKHGGKILALTFGPNDAVLATGSLDNTGRLWRVPAGDELFRITAGAPVISVAISPDATRFVAAGRERVVHVWDVATGHELVSLPHQGEVESVRFSADGSVLASAGGSYVQMWETRNWQQLSRVAHEEAITAIAFQPATTRVATASLDRTARIWDSATGQEIMRWGHDESVQDVSFSVDGRFLATASLDGTAHVLELGYTGLDRIPVHEALTAVAYSPNRRHLAVGTQDGGVMLFDIEAARAGEEIKVGSTVNSISFSHEGRYVAAAGRARAVVVFSVDDHRTVTTLPHSDNVTSVVFSQDGQYVATAGDDRMVRLWRTDTWQQTRQFEHSDQVKAVAISADGDYLAAGTGSFGETHHNALHIWELGSGRHRTIVQDAPVQSVRFSPDGRYLATGCQDFTARVWKVSDGREVARFSHDLAVWSVDFSPDGKYLVTASEDHTSGIWDIGLRREVGRILHQLPVKGIAVSPDGNQLATAGADRTLGLWLWRPDALRQTACQRLTQNLTADEWKRYVGAENYRKGCPNLP